MGSQIQVARSEAAQRVAQMVRVAAKAKQLAREAAWELAKAQMALEREGAMAPIDMATVEQHRVNAMERLAQAKAVATGLEMAMAKVVEVPATVEPPADVMTLKDKVE